MAVIGELLEWLRTDDDDAAIQEARVDLGGGDIATCVDYQSANRDCPPVPGDYAVCVPGPESGSYVIVGWVDPWNQGVAKEGEARLYARDGVDVVGALHVTKDGAAPESINGLVMELVARADKVNAELEAIQTSFESIVFTVDTEPGGDTSGEVATPYVAGKTGCDKVYIT